MSFEMISDIINVETIARGHSIRQIARLRKCYGGGAWRKMKGMAKIRLRSGRIRTAELHWYEAHGVGLKELRIKRFVRES